MLTFNLTEYVDGQVIDENDRLRDIPLSPDADVTYLSQGVDPQPTEGTVQGLIDALTCVDRGDYLYPPYYVWWIEVRDGVIVSLEQVDLLPGDPPEFPC